MRVRLACGRSRVRSLGLATFFFSPVDSSRAVVSYWRKDVLFVLVNHLGSLPRNSVVRLTDRLDMIIVVDWDVNPYMSHVMRKPVFAICEQHRRRSACASVQSDQRLCYSRLRSYNICSFYMQSLKPLTSLCS